MKNILKNRLYNYLLTISMILFLSGCSSFMPDTELSVRPKVPEPLRRPAQSQNKPVNEYNTQAQTPDSLVGETGFVKTPVVSGSKISIVKGIEKKEKILDGEPVKLNINSLPLPAFINEIYGNILKISFEIASSLQNTKDLITLRTEVEILPNELHRLAMQVLANYGVVAEQQGDLLRFIPGKGAGLTDPPLLVSGRTLPEVPYSHRPVFQLVPLKVVRNTDVRGWLKLAFKDQKLEIFEDPQRNAVLVMGAPGIVEYAIQAIRLLDQPNMRGHHSIRIEPVFLTAGELAEALDQVLNSEGFAASLKTSMGSIMLIPVEAVDALLVFAGDQSILDHVKDWAKQLDAPGKKQKSDQAGFFYYQVQNTNAQDLSTVLGKILPGISSGTTSNTPAESKEKNETLTTGLVVDKDRNGIIFNGKRKIWDQLLPVIERMDVPTRMVMIEVTVADINLNDQQELGVEWLLENVGIGSATGVLSILEGTTGANGLTYTLDNAGQTHAVLNAFASKSQVNILSTPRIMVKSGSEATIDVGTEVPIVTSQGTSSDLTTDGTSAILQTIQYRKTGVLLTVKPVIHSGNRIDLEITQEVSESRPNTTSNISSPVIFTRKIITSLGLNDGGSVLLGGLISSVADKGYSGVPILNEIPVLGRLFRVEKRSEVRNDMIMLIVPYIIDNSKEAEEITKMFKQQFSKE
jgi:general secretion pathway protein D